MDNENNNIEDQAQERDDGRVQVEEEIANQGDAIPPEFDFNVDGQPETVRSSNEAGSGITWLEDELTIADVLANSILVSKGNRGEYGTRDYIRNMDAATYALEPKMGVPSHFVSSRDGEVESGNQNKNQYIQELFVSNVGKIEQANLRAEQYDFMDIFMLCSVKNENAVNPRDKFNNDGKNMFLHWDQMKWNNVCHWQSAINR